MDISSLTPLIGNVGVPAIICLYTLFELNKSMKTLAAAIQELTTDLKQRVEKIEQKISKE